MTNVANYHMTIRADIIKEMVAQLENLQVHEINSGDLYHTCSLLLTHFYAQHKINDYQIDVGLKNPDRKSEGYQLCIEIEYHSGAIDEFVLFVDTIGRMGTMPVDPIEAYDRAMGIL